MQDRFGGKTWIFWAQLIIFSVLGLFAITGGILFWTGAVTDAHDEPRPQAGPPMVTIGSFMIATAIMALCNIIASIRPAIQCYRQGIECNLVGRTSLDETPGVPKFVRLAWRFLSLQGFRSQRLRIAWSEFQGASVGGTPIAYVLILRGNAANVNTGKEQQFVLFGQSSLAMHPQRIADALNMFAANENSRDQLPEMPWHVNGLQLLK